MPDVGHTRNRGGDMDERQLRRLEAEEDERAFDDARRGLAVWNATKNPRLLLRTIYGLDNQPIGAFLNTGRLDRVIFGRRDPCIVTIFPFADETSLKQAYGVTARSLESLIAENYVIPLIQNATRYGQLHYLHPILRQRPRNYFIRSVYFYSIFFDETTDLVPNGRLRLAPTLDRLYEKAKTTTIKKILEKVLTERFVEVREPYDRGPFASPEEKKTRITENISYRYASVASFLGEDVTDYILSAFPRERALGVLLDLHYMFDHAWTQGLLSNMHDDDNAYAVNPTQPCSPTRLWWNNQVSRILDANIPVTLLHKPRLSQLDVARSEGFYDDVEKNVSEVGVSDIQELVATLRLRIAEIEDKIERIGAVGQKIEEYRTIAAVFLGLAEKLLPIEDGGVPILGVATGLTLPETVVKPIVRAYQRLVKTHNVDAHLVGYLSNVWSPQHLQSPQATRRRPKPTAN